MDSVKFLEFKNNEDKCRSTASNTVPIACANCGSNDYNIQTLQQANYITPLYPGMPSFKLTSDSFKDNLPINSHLFPKPFFQPVFNNSSILSNAFYAHNNFGLMLPNPYRHLSEEHTQGKCESNNKATQVSNCSDSMLNQTHLMQTCNNEIKLQPKDNNAGGDNMTKDLEKESHSKNPEESDTNYPSQCVCNNPTPWLYSPFILPIISYYILWNSQCSNPKLPPANYPCNHSQMRQNKKEDDEAKVSETSLKEEKDETDFNEPKEKLPKKSKDGVSEDFWTDDKVPKSEWKINNQKNGSSSSFFSISSLDYGEDIFFYTKRKSEAKTMSSNYGAEIGVGKSNATTSPSEHKEAEESSVKCETNQSDTNYAELDEKVKAYPSAPLSADIEEEKEEEEDGEEGENEAENENNENDDDVDEDEDDVKYVNNSNAESLITEQVSDLKIQNGFENETEAMSSEIQLKAGNVPSEDIIESFPSKPSQEKLEDNDSEDKKPIPDYSEAMLKDRVTSKKTIKNFTMADETNSKLYEESKMLAAGGDLGGEHCVGYRVEISPPPRQRGNVQNLNKNENEMETDEILLKDLGKELTDQSKENNENSTNTKKSLEGGELENKSKAKIKLGRNFKSGIAKLSTNFKAKCTDSNTKNSEDKSRVPEIPKTRRKHNCMAIVKTTENNEGNSKIQKSKYSRERQGKNLDSARENVPPNKVQKQSTKSTGSRQKRKDQEVRAPCKSST